MPHKLFVLGATGGLGQQIVMQALDAGHDVTALIRRPAKAPHLDTRLRSVAGALPDDAAIFSAAVRGHDAVISALGRGRSFKADGLIARSVPVIVAAMESAGVRRLIFTSAIGVGDAVREAPLFSRLLIRFLLKDIYADKLVGEDLIRRSGLDWTIVQPAQLTDGPLTSRYQTGDHLKLRGMPKVSRADVAHCILERLDDPSSVRRIVRIGY